MAHKRITVTFDDEHISAERALSVAQITENTRMRGDKDGPYEQLYATYLSGLNGWVLPRKKNGNICIRVSGCPMNPDE